MPLRRTDPNALKSIPYPVTVVTTSVNGSPVGQAAVWVTQVSYAPIRFVVASGLTRHTCAALDVGSFVAINWIESQEVAKWFGRQSGRDVDKFCEGPFRWQWVGGAPVIVECRYAVVGYVFDTIVEGTHKLCFIEVADDGVSEGEASGIWSYSYGQV